MINIYEAVTEKTGENIKVFLAGGITNCPEWQNELISKFEKITPKNICLDLYNPRRKNFPINNPNASEEQIEWEYNKMKEADIILFWFSGGSLNPIVLYELGMWGNSRTTPIVIGIDNAYIRNQDVILQTKLARLEVKIVHNLDDMVVKVIEQALELENNNKG